jgi:hypothetical protein
LAEATPRSEQFISAGLVEFDSLEGMRRFVKNLLDHYQMEADRLEDSVATVMREAEGADKNRSKVTTFPKIWQKKGSLLVDTVDPLRGRIQAMLETTDELRFKITKTTEALMSFEEVEEMDISEDSLMILLISGGVPGKVIVEPRNKPGVAEGGPTIK